MYNDHVYELLDGTQKRLHFRDTNVEMQRRGAESVAELLGYLGSASARRASGSTRMNANSSRSHVLAFVYVSTTGGVGALLTLADLAGSERVARSHAEGARLREANCINASLTALGRCVQALAERRFAPFRECALTKLLRTAL